MFSPAEVLFNSLIKEAEIDKLLADRQAENLHIDFKTLKDVLKPRVDDNFRDFFGKALSGFANSDGGVLVLGVHAPQNGNVSKTPIHELAEFEQRVNELVPRAVSFPIPGVKVARISVSNSENQGFIKVLVPASDLAPHRSQKDHKYYFRSGDSFLPMDHWQLAEVFGRKHLPDLHVKVLVKHETSSQRFRLTLLLVNRGRGIARFPMLKIIRTSLFEINKQGLDARAFGLPQFPSIVNYDHFRGGVNDVIHALTELPVVQLFFNFGHIDLNNIQPQSFEGIFAAEGFAPKKFVVILRPDFIYNSLLDKLTEREVEADLSNI